MDPNTTLLFAKINLIITCMLVVITAWYAISTHKIMGQMKRQSITMVKSDQVLALTALMNAAGHPAGEQPIPKLRAILKEFDINFAQTEGTAPTQQK
jgi:hypothetical protein